jgi:type I restriction enzyme S subunit
LNYSPELPARFYAQKDTSQQQSRTLAALRDALLRKLISGELRVPDVERIVGRVV